VNRTPYDQLVPARDSGEGVTPDVRRSWSGWLPVTAVTAVILLTGAFLLTGCAANPIEEVAVEDVTEEGQASVQPGEQTVSLFGEVDQILTESALTVTDEGSEEPLLVLLTPATIVNGTAVTFGAQPGGIAQVILPEGTLQLIGTLDTFDSVALSERFGIVLNEELFAQWEGAPVLIADLVETFAPDAGLPAETDLESE
jgi:hypothetical protein